MRTWLRTGARIGAGLWLTACAKNVSLGADACPRGAECEVELIALPQESIDIHSTGPALEPMWKVSELPIDASSVRKVHPHAVLATGPSGGVWLFAPEQGRIGVTLVGSDGTAVKQTTVEPPPGTQAATSAYPYIASVASHERGPLVGVHWPKACDESCGPRVAKELLVFGTDADQPPSRVPLASGDDSIMTVHRSADGDAAFVASALHPLMMIDLQGDVRWSDDLSLRQFDELPHGSRRNSSVEPFRSGAVSPSGGIVYSIDIITSEGPPNWSWRPFPIGLLHIDEQGTKSVRVYEGGAKPVGETPESHPNAALAFDPQGRLLVVYSLLDGDLLVLRMTDDQVERFRILREDYADLELYDIAMDPAGTLVIATAGGGRSWETAVPLLCRVPQEGSPRCASIPARTYHIEAPAPNVVFALMGDELARFDFE